MTTVLNKVKIFKVYLLVYNDWFYALWTFCYAAEQSLQEIIVSSWRKGLFLYYKKYRTFTSFTSILASSLSVNQIDNTNKVATEDSEVYTKSVVIKCKAHSYLKSVFDKFIDFNDVDPNNVK